MNLSGSITALATPFGRDDALDLDACGRLIDYQIDGGTRAIVMAGSTGEAAALDENEFSALLEFAVNR
ncbi:MAG TPA: dihydrodipicolinate synthase family protein, partial [Rhodanobacteraceae bacterium]|nr:dihydrodipicolinate synthase family protein [Rhodanobacteraceae bacterium]